MCIKMQPPPLGILLGTNTGTARTPTLTLHSPRDRANGPGGCVLRTMGLGRVELPTSRLSGVRSNHLSYRPYWGTRGLAFGTGENPLDSASRVFPNRQPRVPIPILFSVPSWAGSRPHPPRRTRRRDRRNRLRPDRLRRAHPRPAHHRSLRRVPCPLRILRTPRRRRRSSA